MRHLSFSDPPADSCLMDADVYPAGAAVCFQKLQLLDVGPFFFFMILSRRTNCHLEILPS